MSEKLFTDPARLLTFPVLVEEQLDLRAVAVDAVDALGRQPLELDEAHAERDEARHERVVADELLQRRR